MRLTHRYRGALVTILAALLASLAITAANFAYGRHLLENEDIRYLFLDLVGHPIIWLAKLNKAILPLAGGILKDQALDEWSRIMKLLGAFFGIGFGALAGFYVLLVTHGKAVERSGGVFGWRSIWFVNLALLAICTAYGLVGVGYLAQFREFVVHPIFSQVLTATGGYFALSLLQYCVLSFITYHVYVAVQAWMQDRQRKKWR